MIRMTKITKKVDEELILDAVDLDLYPGEITVLFGPNGSGKTTLMSILVGLVTASEGIVEYEGEVDDTWVKRHAMFVASGNRSLYYRLSGRDNLHYLATLKGVEHVDFNQRLEAVSKIFGLKGLLDKKVQTMSVGQQKRIAIASAFISASKLLILDEPSDGLDHASKKDLIKALLEAKKRNLMVVVASHDLDFVSEIGDWVVCMDHGQTINQIKLENRMPLEVKYQQLKEVLHV